MDTGGGKDGMHLSLEFALLMARNEIEVFILRQYFTKAMMPLDRDCHREMQLSWTKLRMAPDDEPKNRSIRTKGFKVLVLAMALL